MNILKGKSLRRTAPLAVLLAAMAVLAAGCGGGHNVSAGPDETICVYDTSTKVGVHGFIKQVMPNETIHVSQGHIEEVSLPTSVRFYAAVPDSTTRDAGAPTAYDTSDASGIDMKIPGQIGFRFNVGKACDWYTKYGRRNADAQGQLGFNKGTGVATGWTSFLNQYFGLTMADVMGTLGHSYNWYTLYYHFPVNADENGEVKNGKPGQDSVKAFEQSAGDTFTERLKAQLGDEYFCGPASTPGNCQSMTFKIFGRPIVKQDLVNTREALAEQRQQLAADAAAAQYRAEHLKNIINSEKKSQEALQAQIRSTKLSAELARLRAAADHPYCWQVAQSGYQQCPKDVFQSEQGANAQSQTP